MRDLCHSVPASRRRSAGGQEGNPATLTVISTMSGPAPGGRLVHMTPSTGSSPGDHAPPADGTVAADGTVVTDGGLPDWQQVQTLRVADVVMAILQARKTMPSATAAAVSRAKHGDGYRVLVRLLEGGPRADAENVDGGIDGAAAIFVARELGEDLAIAFGDRDVIILQ